MELQPAQVEDVCLAGASIADVLRLLSAGAAGAILMALGAGPLRTKELTAAVADYAPRTIYRYAGRLAELNVVAREEEPGVPSKVTHSLTESCGRELQELVSRFAGASMTLLPDGRIDAHAWASLGLLGELWESGLIEELSCGARSPTELARGAHGLSYHQVNRRAGLLETAGLVRAWQGAGRRRCYELTARTREAAGLVVGIGRWRQRHVVSGDEEGMTAREMAAALRSALPLVRLPGQAGRRLSLRVRGAGDPRRDELVEAAVEADGALDPCTDPGGGFAARAGGDVGEWAGAILEGGAVRVDGDEQLVAELLRGLRGALWGARAF